MAMYYSENWYNATEKFYKMRQQLHRCVGACQMPLHMIFRTPWLEMDHTRLLLILEFTESKDILAAQRKICF